MKRVIEYSAPRFCLMPVPQTRRGLRTLMDFRKRQRRNQGHSHELLTLGAGGRSRSKGDRARSRAGPHQTVPAGKALGLRALAGVPTHGADSYDLIRARPAQVVNGVPVHGGLIPRRFGAKADHLRQGV